MSSETEENRYIQPSHDLNFKGPFTEPIQTIITLMNSKNNIVAFKLKSNTHNHVYMKPNCGEIAPKEKVDILVTLQPFNGANERFRPKILVQTVLIDPVEDYARDGKTFQWKDVEVSRILYSAFQYSYDMSTFEQLDFQNIHNEFTAVLELNAKTELQTTAEIKEIYNAEKNLLKQENLMLKENIMLLQHIINNQNDKKKFINSIWLLDMQDKKKYILMIGLTMVALLGIIAGKYLF